MSKECIEQGYCDCVTGNCLTVRIKELDNSIDSLRDVTNIQRSDGNWNYDPYMHGMANGLILALSMFEGGKLKYLEAPEQWVKDLPDVEVLSKQALENEG